MEVTWWWLSFVKDDTFAGVAIVRGDGVITASQRAWELDINPGGQVAGWPLDVIPPTEWRNRLLSRDEVTLLELELES